MKKFDIEEISVQTNSKEHKLRGVFSMKIGFIVFIIAVFLNLLVLDYYFFKNQEDLKKQMNLYLATQKQEQQIEQKIPLVQDTTCSNSCMTEIKKATASSTIKSNSTGGVTSSVKEFFIPFGSGSSTAGAWADVAGLSAYIDSSQYGSIKSVTFEISITVPTGNQIVWAQLFNETTGSPVWNSEVSMSGGAPQLLLSSPITLSPGNNLYQVQMQTQLQFPANIDQARVHILTN